MEAFVYCWTDNITKKLYVGVHKGEIDDGYICSSKIFLSEFKKRPSDFTRQIIAMGSYIDMYSLETKILQSENVISNDNYYNVAMNNGYFKNKGFPLTEEHRNNIKKSAPKGKNHPMFGKKHDEVTRIKMSDSRKKYMVNNNISMAKENHPMFGKKHSDQHKENIKLSLQGKKRSEQAKINAGEGRAGYYKIITPTGEELIIKNLSKFCKEHNLHMSNLWNRGISKKYKCEHLDKLTSLNNIGD
jgi:hypothetical protein